VWKLGRLIVCIKSTQRPRSGVLKVSGRRSAVHIVTSAWVACRRQLCAGTASLWIHAICFLASTGWPYRYVSGIRYVHVCDCCGLQLFSQTG